MLSVLRRSFYACVTFSAAFLLAPVFWLHPRGRIRLKERFGSWDLPPGEYVWFHGASMGEVNGLLPVLKAFRARVPEARILLTATSPTGLDRAVGAVDELRLLPFDSPPFLRRALRGVRVRLLVITETELWPALIRETSSRGAVLAWVNAFVSDYSFRRYAALRSSWCSLLERFDCILCGNDRARERLSSLGLREDALTVTGNSKYDVVPSVSSKQQALEIRKRFLSRIEPVIVLGSLRPGEEAWWFPAMIECGSRVQFVVAPRHKEKFDYFASKLREAGISFRRWTEADASKEVGVVLLDAYGVLEQAYSFAQGAFIGGSLVDWGGHNPLEAACYGAPLAMGQYARNVREIVADLEQAGALVQIGVTDDARRFVAAVAEGSPELYARGEAALAVWQRHRGAAEKIVSRLQELIK